VTNTAKVSVSVSGVGLGLDPAGLGLGLGLGLSGLGLGLPGLDNISGVHMCRTSENCGGANPPAQPTATKFGIWGWRQGGSPNTKFRHSGSNRLGAGWDLKILFWDARDQPPLGTEAWLIP